MKIPEAKQVAVEFCKVIRQWLTEDQLRQVNELNRSYKASGDGYLLCATGDFCDANIAMDAAFKALGLDPLKTGVPDTNFPLMSEEVLNTWNEAWELAKDAGFDWAKVV